MRQLAALFAAGLVLLSAAGASAADSRGPRFSAAQTSCTIEDGRLGSISGAVAVDEGFLVTLDRGAAIVNVSRDCAFASTRRLAGADAFDVEDLAVGPDGTVWLADIGGNRTPRRNIALFGLTADDTVVTARFAYPGGTHDAEAAVVTMDSVLVVFTKERGTSQVYRARLPGAETTDPVPLRKVGEVDLAAIGGRPGTEGSLLVTGAALSPDGRHVTLRTYTDAYEWEIVDGDVARTVVSTEPVPVGRLRQQQGEAVSYTPDGSRLVAFSEQLPSPVLEVEITRPLVRPASTRQQLPTRAYVVIAVPAALLLLGGARTLYLRRRAPR
ncbi:MAG: hypothetical protein ACRDO1_02325 [Nocardioidaceae bacterium]